MGLVVEPGTGGGGDGGTYVPADERTRVRQLGPPDETYTDAELDARLAALRCPANAPADTPTTGDVYAVAAELWEAKADAYAATQAVAGPAVRSESNGDVSVTYTDGAGADALYAIARRLRRRACNGRPTLARTVTVLAPFQRVEGDPDSFGTVDLETLPAQTLYPSQVLNAPEPGGHRA
jgi:hypothetical protein